MQRLTLLICLFCLILIVSPQSVFAYGTSAGTIITNARDADGNNFADSPGEVVGSYTNTSGFTNFAKATNITVSTVAAGYDLSVINLPADNSSGPGTSVDYTYFITNRGNVSAQISVEVTSNAVHPLWGAASYEVWTNLGAGFGLAFGPANAISNQLTAMAADSSLQLRVRVLIPGGAQDGTTNRYFLEIWDPAWSGGAGDQWPGSGAIAPATADLADARDYQTDYVTTTVTGPVIQLVKSVDLSSARPYEELAYIIKYTNIGSGPAYNVTVDDVIYTNFVRIIADSAEASNTAAHNPTNYYYDGSTWQGATWDTGNENSVQRLRWVLRNSVNAGAGGVLKFKVRIE